jgi:hypothetical protein
VAANASPRDTWLRRARLSWLLPEWRFFAPNPATHDYELFIRFRAENLGPSEPVIARFPPRLARDAVFNPHTRPRKATRDAIERLLLDAHGVGVSDLQEPTVSIAPDLCGTSTGYAALLREATRATPERHYSHVQFGILLIEGLCPYRLLFVSRWHRVR